MRKDLKTLTIIPMYLVIFGSVSLHADKAQNALMRDAIETSDVLAVRGLLKKVEPLKTADKTSWIKFADDVIGEKRELTSLLKSPRDLIRFLFGATVTVSCTGLAGFFFRRYLRCPLNSGVDPEERRTNLVYSGLSAGVVILGVIAMVKGWYCDTAYANVKLARLAKEAIEKALVEGATGTPQLAQKDIRSSDKKDQ